MGQALSRERIGMRASYIYNTGNIQDIIQDIGPACTWSELAGMDAGPARARRDEAGMDVGQSPCPGPTRRARMRANQAGGGVSGGGPGDGGAADLAIAFRGAIP